MMTNQQRIEFYLSRGWCPVPWAHHPKPVRDAIRAIGFRPQMKQCWANSQRLFVENARRRLGLNLEYHEGLASYIMPFEHAWLVYEGEILDLTTIPGSEMTYLNSVVYTVEEVTDSMTRNGTYSPVSSPYEKFVV